MGACGRLTTTTKEYVVLKHNLVHIYDVQDNKYCGSVYDSFGNARFTSPTIMLLEDNYIPELNFGYTTFDNLLVAFLTIFQCVTEEGWVDIMYQIQDGFNGIAGAVVFILLLVFGSFLLLNLTLAVLE